ncbi:hypothetical protein V6N12_016201 [Hibiscus sabdariffa]|uniref:Uncharacterized protein n=1 Tax=Hibiscus sabdariffa TaxID=183260 RepID=A0ABR2C923_9ROSI
MKSNYSSKEQAFKRQLWVRDYKAWQHDKRFSSEYRGGVSIFVNFVSKRIHPASLNLKDAANVMAKANNRKMDVFAIKV